MLSPEIVLNLFMQLNINCLLKYWLNWTNNEEKELRARLRLGLWLRARLRLQFRNQIFLQLLYSVDHRS